jgi:L-lactate dehydrogenase complex protein LldE
VTRERVQLFVTCMVDLFRPQAGMAAVEVLERRGVTVEFPAGQTCCGQFAYNAGHHREAAAMGRQLVRAFETDAGAADEGAVPVVALSGSCAAMVAHELPELLEHDAVERGRSQATAARWRERAEGLAGRLVELSTWLDGRGSVGAGERSTAGAAETGGEEGGGEPSASSLPLACHTGCHMRRLLHETEAPLRVLESAGAAPQELPDADQCCGFGGTFGLVEPDLSAAMADAKLDALATLRSDGAAGLVSADLGCLMQLGGRLSRRGDAFPALHLAEVVALADAGRLTPAALAEAAGTEPAGTEPAQAMEAPRGAGD